MKQATFRMMHFPKVNRWIGLAWNYDEAVLLSSTDYDSYTEAQQALKNLADTHEVELKWFDGEYTVENDILLPRV